MNWMDVNRTFAELDLFRQEMDRLFANALGTELTWGSALSEGRDVGARLEANDAAYVLSVDLPGVKPADIDLQVTRDGVTLRAKREVGKPKGYSTHRQERGAFEISRSWTLPKPIDPETATAETKDGMLKLTLPYSAEVQPRRIEVKA